MFNLSACNSWRIIVIIDFVPVSPHSKPVAFASLLYSAVSAPSFVERESTQLNMIDVDMNSVATTSNMIATAAADNGGYFFPVVGLAALAATILFLAPPLVDE